MAPVAQLWKRGKDLLGLDPVAKAARRDALELYQRIVAKARDPRLYSECGVPDTPDGRLEMVQLHVILILRRLQRGTEADQAVGQSLFNVFFKDVDNSLREAGVGDLSVGKWVRKIAEQFYARVADIETGLERGDAEHLADALDRNVLGAAGQDPRALVQYLLQEDRVLAEAAAGTGTLPARLRFS